MKTFPSEPVKTTLKSKPEDPLHFFREMLADALPSPTMAGIAFAIHARTLLRDKPGALAGYPSAMYAMIAMDLPDIAREVLPEDVGEEIARHLETT